MTAVAAGLSLLAAPTAHAASHGRWMPAHELTTQAAIEPRVAITASGEGIAAWGVRGPDPTMPGAAVSASIRPPGGQFGQPRVISPNEATFVDMAANAAGDAAIGYFASNRLGAVFRSALDDWSAPADFDAQFSRLLVDGAGNTTIVYLEDERVDTDREIQKHVAYHLKAKTRFADGSVGPWREIARAYVIQGPDAAVDGTGTVTAAWRQTDEYGADTQVFTASSAPGGEFSPPHVVDGPRHHDNSTHVRVVANRRGDALVAWGAVPPGYQTGGPMSPQVVHSSFRPAGGPFGPVERIDVPEDIRKGLYRWDLAMDDDGDTTVAWSNAHHGGRAVRPVAGPWSATVPLGEFPLEPTVAVDGKRTATIAYVERGAAACCGPSGPPRLMAVRRPRGGDFGKAAQLTTAKYIFGPDSASDALGNTIVVWSHEERWAWGSDRTEHGIGAAIWDAAAPSVREFELDPDGEPAGAQAPAFDFALSEAAAVSVSVERMARRPVPVAKLKARSPRGEGTIAIGSKVERKLRVRGSYRATITARDSAGRTSKPRRLTFGRLGR